MTINSLLNQLSVPLLLLWGENDPWIGPRAADRMLKLYPQAKKVGLEAGHCPHDEVREKDLVVVKVVVVEVRMFLLWGVNGCARRYVSRGWYYYYYHRFQS